LLFVIFALCIVSIAIGSGGRESYAAVPGANLSVYLILLALGSLAALLVTTLGFTRRRGKVFFSGVFTLGLFLLLSMIVAVSALTRDTTSFASDAYFEEKWQLEKESQRADLEHEFGCCGFNSQADFYGTRLWNSTCSGSKNVCCSGVKQWDRLQLNRSEDNGNCTLGQLRYQCCVSTTAWPCYRLQPCRGVVLSWFQERFQMLGTYALTVAALSGLSLVLLTVINLYLDGQDDEEVEL
jgi:hypothetical protein